MLLFVLNETTRGGAGDRIYPVQPSCSFNDGGFTILLSFPYVVTSCISAGSVWRLG